MSYKAIGFDWGGVLNGKPASAFSDAISNLLEVSVDQYREAYFTHNKEFNRGSISVEELWARVLNDLKKPERFDEVIELVAIFDTQKPNQEVISIVDKLRLSGYKVGMLSNHTHEKATELRLAGLDAHFDVFHVSAETGFVKPEPEAFLHLAQDLNVHISELIFIDDTKVSLSSAAEIGFTPILYTSFDQLLDSLAKLDIKFTDT